MIKGVWRAEKSISIWHAAPEGGRCKKCSQFIECGKLSYVRWGDKYLGRSADALLSTKTWVGCRNEERKWQRQRCISEEYERMIRRSEIHFVDKV